jgi:hypothetical protein
LWKIKKFVLKIIWKQGDALVMGRGWEIKLKGIVSKRNLTTLCF